MVEPMPLPTTVLHPDHIYFPARVAWMLRNMELLESRSLRFNSGIIAIGGARGSRDVDRMEWTRRVGDVQGAIKKLGTESIAYRVIQLLWHPTPDMVTRGTGMQMVAWKLGIPKSLAWRVFNAATVDIALSLGWTEESESSEVQPSRPMCRECGHRRRVAPISGKTSTTAKASPCWCRCHQGVTA